MPKYSNIIYKVSTKGISSLLKKLTLDYGNFTELKPYKTKENAYFLLFTLWHTLKTCIIKRLDNL
jgi:hypothetical protein